MMKSEKLTRHAATLIVIFFGVGAIVMLVDAMKSFENEPAYADIDPTNINTDYERKNKAP